MLRTLLFFTLCFASFQASAEEAAPKKSDIWGHWAGAKAGESCPKAKEKAITAAMKMCEARRQEIQGGYTIGKCVTDAVHVSTVKVTFACVTAEIKAGARLSVDQDEACANDVSKWCTDSTDVSGCLKSKSTVLASRCHQALGIRTTNTFMMGPAAGNRIVR